MAAHFELLTTDTATAARRGRLRTRHGLVETPIFMPVGTQGSVKCMSPDELRELKAQIILGNTYHLITRPGLELIQATGSAPMATQVPTSSCNVTSLRVFLAMTWIGFTPSIGLHSASWL